MIHNKTYKINIFFLLELLVLFRNLFVKLCQMLHPIVITLLLLVEKASFSQQHIVL